MKWYIVLLVVAFAVPSIVAGIPTRYYTVSCSGGYIHAKDGKPILDPGNTDANRDAPDHWYLVGNSIKSSIGEGYLAYDTTGRSNKLSLSSKIGAHTEWEIVETRGKTPGDRDEARATIRAVNGPMKGWKIDVEGVRLSLTKNPTTPARANRVVLHK